MSAANDDRLDPLVRKFGAEPCPGCGRTDPYRHTIECGGFGSIERGVWKCRCGWTGPECVSTWKDGLDKWNKRIANGSHNRKRAIASCPS
jgi:hypothetical protein